LKTAITFAAGLLVHDPPGGRAVFGPRQWRDVQGILKVTKLDRDYVRRRAGEREVPEPLERAYAEAGLGSG